MKIIGARGTGKNIFVIAFLHSLVFERIIRYEDVLVFTPIFNQQIQWVDSRFGVRDSNHLRKDLA